jgi:hypothetical protein
MNVQITVQCHRKHDGDDMKTDFEMTQPAHGFHGCFNGKFLLGTVFNENVLQNIMKFNKYMNRLNKIIYYFLPSINPTPFTQFFGGEKCTSTQLIF